MLFTRMAISLRHIATGEGYVRCKRNNNELAITCGTTNNSEDLMLVGMGEVVDLNDTLFEIADLPPGWCADRQSEGGGWNRYRDESI
jgi:hypothetical protein